MPDKFQVETRGIPEVEKMLFGIKNGANKAIVRAINKTVVKAESLAAKGIVQEFNVAQKTVKECMKSTKANYSTLSAKIHTEGGPVPLGKMLRISKGLKGVTLRVLKSGKRALIKHAFIATMPLSKNAEAFGSHAHVGVFWRAEKADAPNYHARSLFKHQKALKGKGKYVPRLPIQELYGPKVPGILEKAKVINPVMEDSSEILQKNLAHEADFVLESSR